MRPIIVYQLAEAFRKQAQIQLGSYNCCLIDIENKRRSEETSCCASHDYCDAKMLMNDALSSLGLDMELLLKDGGQEAIDIWNAAWTLTRATGFSKTKLA